MKVVYTIRNIINDKMYIGSSKCFYSRKKSHINLLNRGKSSSKLQYAWDKYGQQSFEFYILEEVPDSLDIVYREEELILQYNSIKNGYNIKLPFSEQKQFL